MYLKQLILYSMFFVIYWKQSPSEQLSIAKLCNIEMLAPRCYFTCNSGVCRTKFCNRIFCCSYRCDDCYWDNKKMHCCENGYVLTDKRKCVPYCFQECQNGWCSVPKTCSCNSASCINGNCIKGGRCICNRGYRLKSESHAQKNKVCEPICNQPKCGSNMKCIAPNKCECLENYRWNNNTSQCILKCFKCINGTLEGELCACNKGYNTDPSNNCKCISKCSSPCISGYCSESGRCACKENYNWNENTSQCELKYNNSVNERCMSIMNKTFSPTPIDKICINYICKNVSDISNENAEINDKMIVDSKYTKFSNNICETITFACSEYIKVCEKTKVCERYKRASCNCSEKLVIENFPCDLICDSNKDNFVPNGTAKACDSDHSYQEKMEESESLQPILYLIPICVTLFVVVLIVTGIIIRNTLKKRKLSTNPEGGTSTSTLQKKSDDEEIVENVELYGSI